MATMASKVGELADGDGSYFPREFEEALEAAPSITSKVTVPPGWLDAGDELIGADLIASSTPRPATLATNLGLPLTGPPLPYQR